MAEFTVVMPQFARLCDCYSKKGCEGCPIEQEGFNCACDHQGCSKSSAEELEHIIMSWAAANPKPAYPTWWDWLAAGGLDPDDSIPADIAEKLGIEPKEGT